MIVLRDRVNARVRAEQAERQTPLRSWRCDTLMSAAARRGWVEPDAAPLPF